MTSSDLRSDLYTPLGTVRRRLVIIAMAALLPTWCQRLMFHVGHGVMVLSRRTIDLVVPDGVLSVEDINVGRGGAGDDVCDSLEGPDDEAASAAESFRRLDWWWWLTVACKVSHMAWLRATNARKWEHELRVGSCAKVWLSQPVCFHVVYVWMMGAVEQGSGTLVRFVVSPLGESMMLWKSVLKSHYMKANQSGTHAVVLWTSDPLVTLYIHDHIPYPGKGIMAKDIVQLARLSYGRRRSSTKACIPSTLPLQVTYLMSTGCIRHCAYEANELVVWQPTEPHPASSEVDGLE